MRLAWFSPMPPHRSGIAAYSAEILGRLAGAHEIEAFVDDTTGPAAVRAVAPVPGVAIRGAHDFPWAHPLRRHDAAVYQLGNDLCHDYMWPYLVRYPGLVLLHDAQLHQSRARGLIRRGRDDDYIAEFRYSHPEADPDIAKLVIAGLGGSLYYYWPMIRVPIEAAKVVGVHSAWLARTLGEQFPGRRFVHVRHGFPDITPQAKAGPAEVRRRHGLPEDAVVFGSFGRVTPEKSLTHVLLALAQVAADAPAIRLLVVGDTPEYYDLRQEAHNLGVADRVAVTGYVADDDLPEYLAAVDVCLNLRWPTARETSGAWVRCLAAGKPTVITDLLHLGDVPSLDLRSGKVQCTASPAGDAVCVAVELVDEIHMLRLALRHLGTDSRLRARLGDAAKRYWQREATMDVMARDYETALAETAAAPAPAPPEAWPPHLTANGMGTLQTIVGQMGIETNGL